MAGIEFYETAPEGVLFRQGAFDRCVGRPVPFRFRPGGRRIGTATVTAVAVDPDGLGATWTVDVPDDCPVLLPMREGRPGFSFRFRLPDPRWPELAVVADRRDPLAARAPAVTRKGGTT